MWFYINLNSVQLTVISALYFQEQSTEHHQVTELQWSKINPLLCPSFNCVPLQVVFPPPPPPSPDHSPFPPPNLLLLPTNSDPLEQHRGGQLVLSLFLSGNAIMISLIIFLVDIDFTDSDDSVITDKSPLIVSPEIL